MQKCSWAAKPGVQAHQRPGGNSARQTSRQAVKQASQQACKLASRLEQPTTAVLPYCQTARLQNSQATRRPDSPPQKTRQPSNKAKSDTNDCKKERRGRVCQRARARERARAHQALDGRAPKLTPSQSPALGSFCDSCPRPQVSSDMHQTALGVAVVEGTRRGPRGAAAHTQVAEDAAEGILA